MVHSTSLSVTVFFAFPWISLNHEAESYLMPSNQPVKRHSPLRIRFVYLHGLPRQTLNSYQLRRVNLAVIVVYIGDCLWQTFRRGLGP
jgi:hypothetical protein